LPRYGRGGLIFNSHRWTDPATHPEGVSAVQDEA
jgi:hypothetical protein